MPTIIATPSADNANAYADLAFVDTHHLDRGNTAWATFIQADRESAIIRATDYIDKRFGKKFRGIRQTKGQSLEWPRLDAFDDDGYLLSGVDEIPRNLQKASAEYALRALIYMTLAPDPSLPVPAQDMTDPTFTRETDVITGEVTRKRDKVGPLEEERWYETRAQVIARRLAAGSRSLQSTLLNDFNIPEYPEADLWIEELIRSSMNIRLARGD
jgi:hypothetical protein